jgi:hypothetical protein
VRLPRLLAGGTLAAVLTGTAACGLPAVEPKLELRAAMSDFAAGRTGTLALSVPSSVDDVRAFAEAADPAGSDAEMTDDDLQRLLSSSVEVGYDLGEDRDSDADDASRVIVRLDDLEAGELRAIDGLLYVRVDVEGLAAEFPELQAELDSFRAGLTGEPGAAEPAPASMIESATALLDGDWVSVDVQAYLDYVQAFLDQLAAAGGADPGIPAAGPSFVDSTEARDLLGAALEGAVSSVERRGADDELGNHLVVGLDLRTAYGSLRAGLPGLFTGETADMLEEKLPAVDEVPDRRIDVSFWVRDGDLTRVELDLAQFLDEPAGHLVMRADVVGHDEITAPSGAVEFDVAGLMEAGMSAFPPGDAPAEDVPDPVARTVATWVDMDFASVAYDHNALPSVAYLPDVLPYYEGIDKMLDITAVGQRIEVTFRGETVCLTLSVNGYGEDIVDGPC